MSDLHREKFQREERVISFEQLDPDPDGRRCPRLGPGELMVAVS